MVAVPYPLFEQVRRLVESQHGQILDEDFGADVMLSARFVVEDLPPFQDALSELSNGRLQAEIVETNQATIMPIHLLRNN
jgi:putative IMPACT (imprinted ancient) family translation regulator